MPRKQVEPLYKKTLTLVNESIWSFTRQHWNSNCSFCKVQLRPEICPVMKNAKEQLFLPTNIIQDLFDFLPYRTQCRGSTKQMRHLICFLMYHSGLKMGSFVFFQEDNTLFLMKYGQNIQSLYFMCSVRWCDVPVIKAELETLWRPILVCVSNIQLLHLGNAFSLSDQQFEIIGRELNQLQSLEGFKLKSTTTAESFEKLCFTVFEGKRILNNCCNTLRKVEIYYYGDETEKKRLNGILAVLFRNMPNLKSLVRSFDADKYLESVGTSVVLNAPLEEIINVHRLTKDIVPLLKSFVPNMKFLCIADTEDGVFDVLHSNFPSLEMLTHRFSDTSHSALLLHDIISPVWSKMKHIDISITPAVLDLSNVAKNLPVLEKLVVFNCKKLAWDGITYFNCLSVAHFHFTEASNVSGLACLAKTITQLSMTTIDEFDKNMLSVFTKVPFPVLKKLRVDFLKYNFDFVVNVIERCLLLEKFALFYKEEHDRNYNEEKDLAIKQLCKFLADNNYDCNIFK